MSLIDQLKEHLKEGVNLEEVQSLIAEGTKLTPDVVKAYVAHPNNKPVFDSIAGKAITSHIEKEKAARAEWENMKADELLEQAKQTIAKENQKTPEMLEIEKLQKLLADKDASESMATLKSRLQSVVNGDKLPIHSVEPFVHYGAEAEDRLREYATQTNALIDDLVKKQISTKYGAGEMLGGDKPPVDNKPISTQDHLNSIFAGTPAGGA